jgi:glycosyltransferase involved in cell wall biosynthesis
MPSSPTRRPIRVLQVVPELETGGAERTTVDIAAALSGRGDRALVASRGGRMEPGLKTAGGVLVRLDVAAKHPVALATNVLALMRLIRRERIDLVHARSRAPAWSSLLACRRTGTPFVTTYHGIYNETGAAKRFYNSVMARGDMVIANSQYTADLIRQRYGTPAGRIRVIPRGVDLALFSPAAVHEAQQASLRAAWRLSGDETVVLNVARLTGWKGQRVLIEAVPLLAEHRNFVLVLAGDDQGRSGYRNELESRIAALGLGELVRIVGHCDDVPAALSLASVAVVASTEPEAFGRFALEAQAMGIPVVATALGAAPETVLAPPRVNVSERTGWLVPPNEPAQMAGAIGEALALSLLEKEALAARARQVAAEFSTAAMQAATLAVYDGLLAQGNTGDL